MQWSTLSLFSSLAHLTRATILQNGQVRETDFLKTAVTASTLTNWTAHSPDSQHLSYKGRWDSQHISWWSSPGLKFGVHGNRVAISFGNNTSDGVLVGFRFDGLDWQLTNITTGATHLFAPAPTDPVVASTALSVFELRVSNFAYGVQIASVLTPPDSSLFTVPDFGRRLEMIGDSLSAGYSATYEGLASFGHGLCAGLGDTEYSITAIPGICVHDQECFGNPRGQTFQWYQTSDTSGRAQALYGDKPIPWDFQRHPAADIVVINLGTNDNNSANNVGVVNFYNSYVQLVEGVHQTWPEADIVIMSLWNGFYQSGTTYKQSGGYVNEVYDVYQHFNNGTSAVPGTKPFVHYFNSTGILQHNDINPAYHPTDVGNIKLASHMMQYIKNTFGWEFAATGPEIQHETLYWNNEVAY
ncbi:acetylxylan esterase [Diplocarpon mali]|nr:acetylxylan esterase [Diplocarpon mali]